MSQQVTQTVEEKKQTISKYNLSTNVNVISLTGHQLQFAQYNHKRRQCTINNHSIKTSIIRMIGDIETIRHEPNAIKMTLILNDYNNKIHCNIFDDNPQNNLLKIGQKIEIHGQIGFHYNFVTLDILKWFIITKNYNIITQFGLEVCFDALKLDLNPKIIAKSVKFKPKPKPQSLSDDELYEVDGKLIDNHLQELIYKIVLQHKQIRESQIKLYVLKMSDYTPYSIQYELNVMVEKEYLSTTDGVNNYYYIK